MMKFLFGQSALSQACASRSTARIGPPSPLFSIMAWRRGWLPTFQSARRAFGTSPRAGTSAAVCTHSHNAQSPTWLALPIPRHQVGLTPFESLRGYVDWGFSLLSAPAKMRAAGHPSQRVQSCRRGRPGFSHDPGSASTRFEAWRRVPRRGDLTFCKAYNLTSNTMFVGVSAARRT